MSRVKDARTEGDLLDIIWQLTESMESMRQVLTGPMRSEIPAELHIEAVLGWYESRITELREILMDECGSSPY